MRGVSFETPTPAEIRELDRLAAELRGNRRTREVARGLAVTDAFALVFAEQAGRTGGR